jgi:hypothetical protein
MGMKGPVTALYNEGYEQQLVNSSRVEFPRTAALCGRLEITDYEDKSIAEVTDHWVTTTGDQHDMHFRF